MKISTFPVLISLHYLRSIKNSFCIIAEFYQTTISALPTAYLSPSLKCQFVAYSPGHKQRHHYRQLLSLHAYNYRYKIYQATIYIFKLSTHKIAMLENNDNNSKNNYRNNDSSRITTK